MARVVKPQWYLHPQKDDDGLENRSQAENNWPLDVSIERPSRLSTKGRISTLLWKATREDDKVQGRAMARRQRGKYRHQKLSNRKTELFTRLSYLIMQLFASLNLVHNKRLGKSSWHWNFNEILLSFPSDRPKHARLSQSRSDWLPDFLFNPNEMKM